MPPFFLFLFLDVQSLLKYLEFPNASAYVGTHTGFRRAGSRSNPQPSVTAVILF